MMSYLTRDAFADAGGDGHRYVDLVAALGYAEAAGAVVTDAVARPIQFGPDLSRRWSGIVAATPELAGELASVSSSAARQAAGQEQPAP
jgi:myo-inositol-1(or 4)-monophosphatase